MTTLRKHWLEAAWGVFALGNVAVLLRLRDWETIPFHFVWISLSLLYSVRVWPLRITLPVLAIVCAVTGAALGWVVVGGPQGYDELTEVPLMAGVYLVMVRHALQRQRALNELRVASQREHDFVRDASHQLRTPLTIALGHAELIRKGRESIVVPRTNTRRSNDIEIVIEELKRLSRISDRLLLLEVSQSRGGREEVDIDRLVGAAMRRWLGTAQRRWVASVSAHGTVPGDEEQLALALDSLIENALEATTGGDQIAIIARAEGDDAIIAVSDSGRGLVEKDRERVFDRFWQGDHRQRGTGLGLSIVKAIVERQGGSVGLESELGKGTTFSIRLGGFRPAEPARPMGGRRTREPESEASAGEPQPIARSS